MKETTSKVKLIISMAIAVLIAVSCGILLLTVFSAVSLSVKDPLSYVKPLSLLALGLTSVICGVTVSLLNRKCDLPAYLLGCVSGAILVIILFSVGFVPIGGSFTYSGAVRTAIYGGIVLLSAAGAALVRPRKRKHRNYPQIRRRR